MLQGHGPCAPGFRPSAMLCPGFSGGRSQFPSVPALAVAPRTCRRAIVNGILLGLRTDCAKHSLPHGYPDWHWVYHYFREWQQERVWERIHEV